MDTTKNVKIVPVSSLLAVIIIVVFSLYFTTAIKTLPCGQDVMSSFYSNFIHVEPQHLIVNLYALYALSRVEEKIGPRKFISIITFSLIFNTIVETSIYKWMNVPCSIGFSGVLFSILTWEMVTTKKLDLYLLSAVVSMVVIPSIMDKKVSFTGHAVGAISGVISGIIWNKMNN
jgi:membrane associated rhomboid family serine protease